MLLFFFFFFFKLSLTEPAAPRRGRRGTSRPWTTGSPASAGTAPPAWSPRRWAGSPAACQTGWTSCCKRRKQESEGVCSFSFNSDLISLLEKLCGESICTWSAAAFPPRRQSRRLSCWRWPAAAQSDGHGHNISKERAALAFNVLLTSFKLLSIHTDVSKEEMLKL